MCRNSNINGGKITASIRMGTNKFFIDNLHHVSSRHQARYIDEGSIDICLTSRPFTINTLTDILNDYANEVILLLRID